MNKPPPNVRLAFPVGPHSDALRQYFSLKDWAFSNGLAYRQDLTGIINSPMFDGKPVPGNIVPPEWIEQDKWQASMDLWVENREALEWVKRLAPPPGAQFE